MHGTLAPSSIESKAGATALADGVLALSGYVANLRAQRPGQVLLVDAGDLFQGTMAVNLTRGRAMIDAYNALGYDASAIGNHEFDYGPSARQPDVPTGALEDAIAQAHFPFLAANLDDRASHQRPLWKNLYASVLKDVGGIRVGIVGVSTPTTPSGTLSINVRDVSFAAPAARIAREAAALRAAGAELVVLLAHMGGQCQNAQNANDLSSCTPADGSTLGELFTALSAMAPGTIDVAVGGHTHQQIAHWYNDIAVVQSGAFGRYFGRVDACLPAPDARRGATPLHLDRAHTRIYPPQRLCLTTWPDGSCKPYRAATSSQPAQYAGRPVCIDPAVSAAVAPYLQAVTDKEQTRIGAVLAHKTDAGTLAQYAAEGLRRTLRADFGLQNRGGIRTALEGGPVHYGDLFRCLPFDNQAVRVRMTGAQIEALVRAIARGRPASSWPRLSGLVLLSQPGEPLMLRTAKGARLEPTRHYTMATSDFILAGGDGAEGMFAGVAPGDIELQHTTLRDSLAQLLVQLHPLR